MRGHQGGQRFAVSLAGELKCAVVRQAHGGTPRLVGLDVPHVVPGSIDDMRRD